MKILNSNILILVLLVLITTSVTAQNSKFKVVLDAGHGGKDPGSTYHGNIEKNISLNIVLKVGAILKNENNIEIIYTRDKDVFVELDDRAKIANKSKANIFVSMHCNANKNINASGNETYVMGITRNASNLEVAKNENSVITYEDNYEIKYEGFDPNSPESVIGISILQEEYRELSVELASKVQQAFTKKTSAKNRGVKEAGFLVLRKITMPRVLIEMGFVSNINEGAFLNSESGQNILAEAIAKSIIDYKLEFFATPTVSTLINEPKTTTKTDNTSIDDTIVFKVQIASSKNNLDTKSYNFNGLEQISKEKKSNTYKYYYENTMSYEQASTNLKIAKTKGYKSAFIVAFKNGEKINMSEALK
ncbi:N-acetylmuramoyl-L-alanine amidase [uncultured Flavobacterium sp.]|uniref:N-acetylmuramoyl-L-alanine amidase family protein n=1 Tax=uncultured Flavobacterium sp. TaxID=165435 RepID=UPI0030CA2403